MPNHYCTFCKREHNFGLDETGAPLQYAACKKGEPEKVIIVKCRKCEMIVGAALCIANPTASSSSFIGEMVSAAAIRGDIIETVQGPVACGPCRCKAEGKVARGEVE